MGADIWSLSLDDCPLEINTFRYTIGTQSQRFFVFL